MSTQTAKANWNIAKGKFKQRIARLMQDDIHLFLEGKVDELVGRIQKRASVSGSRGDHPYDLNDDGYGQQQTKTR